MSRYCFISTLPSWKKDVEREYEGVDVTLTVGGPQNEEEGCVTLNDPAEKTNLRQINKRLGAKEDFSTPLFTPDWQSLETNHGPFITEDHYVQKVKHVLNKKTGDMVLLSKRAELALFAYTASKNGDAVFKSNFNSSFERLTGQAATDLDLSAFEFATVSLPIPDRNRYGYVTIDGKKTPLVTFATPITSVFSMGPDAGKIRPGIGRNDVIVNSSGPVPGFSTLFIPGSSWAAKWRDPLLGHFKYVFIDFEDEYPEEESEAESSVGSMSIASEASVASQYGKDLSESEDATVQYFPQGTRVELDVPDVNDETVRQDFDSLTDEERRLLPLSYVLSPADQWRVIHTALASNFRSTDGLPKVSDRALSNAADAIAYSIQLGNSVPNAAYSLLQYASKRDV